jgi:hypothetical protein
LSSCAHVVVSVEALGIESRKIVEFKGNREDSRTEEPPRIDVSPRSAVAIGPSKTDGTTSSDEALKLAIKLAVDAGEYDRAAALLEVARRTTEPAAKDEVAEVVVTHVADERATRERET